jgi:hypothetical protein
MWQDRNSTKVYEQFLNKDQPLFDVSEYGTLLMKALQMSYNFGYDIVINNCKFVIKDSNDLSYELTYEYTTESFKTLCSLMESIATFTKL